MSRLGRITVVGAAVLSVTLVGCGGRGLPDAGPQPGEVDVGYGGRPAEEVTGAISSMSEERVVAGNPRNVAEMLSGRVPGLQVLRRANGDVTYRIRGVGSLNNDQEPLFILDGVPLAVGSVNAMLGAVAPDEVRRIDVLKDVASTAVYGMRGAGGVIIIHTRR